MSKNSGIGTAVTELILTIFLTNGRLMKAGDTLLHDLGLTGARWQVLGAIKDRPRTVAQIARQYELSRQGVLWIVQSLLKDGTVEYLENPDHKRSKLLVFSDRGRRIYDEVERRQQVWSSELERAFAPGELEQTTQCLRRLGAFVKPGDPDDEK